MWSIVSDFEDRIEWRYEFSQSAALNGLLMSAAEQTTTLVNEYIAGYEAFVAAEDGDDGDKKQPSKDANADEKMELKEDADEETKEAEEKQQQEQHLENYKNHCHATDQGSQKYIWKNLRTAIKDGRDPRSVNGGSTAGTAAAGGDDYSSLAQYYERYTVPASASAAASATARLEAMLNGTAEYARQRHRQRYRQHATGRGGAHQMRSARGADSHSRTGVYGSVSMDAANAMDFSSSTTTTRRRRRRERRTRQENGDGDDNDNDTHQRSRHSSHRDRMRTQAILEDLYS